MEEENMASMEDLLSIKENVAEKTRSDNKFNRDYATASYRAINELLEAPPENLKDLDRDSLVKLLGEKISHEKSRELGSGLPSRTLKAAGFVFGTPGMWLWEFPTRIYKGKPPLKAAKETWEAHRAMRKPESSEWPRLAFDILMPYGKGGGLIGGAVRYGKKKAAKKAALEAYRASAPTREKAARLADYYKRQTDYYEALRKSGIAAKDVQRLNYLRRGKGGEARYVQGLLRPAERGFDVKAMGRKFASMQADPESRFYATRASMTKYLSDLQEARHKPPPASTIKKWRKTESPKAWNKAREEIKVVKHRASQKAYSKRIKEGQSKRVKPTTLKEVVPGTTKIPESGAVGQMAKKRAAEITAEGIEGRISRTNNSRNLKIIFKELLEDPDMKLSKKQIEREMKAVSTFEWDKMAVKVRDAGEKLRKAKAEAKSQKMIDVKPAAKTKKTITEKKVSSEKWDTKAEEGAAKKVEQIKQIIKIKGELAQREARKKGNELNTGQVRKLRVKKQEELMGMSNNEVAKELKGITKEYNKAYDSDMIEATGYSVKTGRRAKKKGK